MSLLSVFENSVRLPAEHTGIFFFTKLLIVSFPLAPFHSTVFSSLVGHPPPRFLTAQHTGWWWSLWRRRLRNKKKRCLKFFLFYFSSSFPSKCTKVFLLARVFDRRKTDVSNVKGREVRRNSWSRFTHSGKKWLDKKALLKAEETSLKDRGNSKATSPIFNHVSAEPLQPLIKLFDQATEVFNSKAFFFVYFC